MKNCLVVLGMHRSGTSAFTGILEGLGVNLGSSPRETQADNPRRIFENKFVVSANDSALETLGTSWDDTFPMRDDWPDTLVNTQVTQIIRSFLRNEIKEDELFAFQDPRLSKLLPLWLPLFPEENIKIHFVLLVRNPLEIAESLKRTNGFSTEKSLILWMQHMIEAERRTRGQARSFVSFEALLKNPHAAVKSAFSAIGLPVPQLSQARSDALSQLFDRKLQNHQFSNAGVDVKCSTVIAEFYRVLCTISEREKSSSEDIERLDELSQSFVLSQSLFYNKDLVHKTTLKEHKSEPDWYRLELNNIKQQFETDKVYREYRYLANTEFLYKDRSALQSDVERLETLQSEIELVETLLDQSVWHAQWHLYKRYRTSRKKSLPPGSLPHRLLQRGKQILIGALAVSKRMLAKIAPTKANAEEAGLSAVPPDLVTGKAQETPPALRSLSFPTVLEPAISIVIPVSNNWELTYTCLQSVYEHTVGSYEIIVFNDNSTDATPNPLASIAGLRVITKDSKEAAVNACKQATEVATGDYILLLNNDIEVGPGWLEALLDPFRDTSTGIVGAKFVYPDGILEASGGITWRDGTGCNYGHGDDPNLPQYCYKKAVDYCSGACLIVPRKLWEEIGGFDPRYDPAHYDDIDLCFTVRSMGYNVIYQPRAVVTHHGDTSAGKEPSSGYKRLQETNRHKFLAKWQIELERDHYPGLEHLATARERTGNKHILVIDSDVPTFDRDSGSVRMFSMLQILLDMGYKVSFWPDQLCYKQRYTAALQDIGVETYYGDINFEEFIIEQGQNINAVIMSRPATAIKYVHLVKQHSPAQTIFDTVDLHFLREQRRLEREVQHWKNMEFYLAEETDNTLVVSPTEKALLSTETFASKVAVVSNIHTLEECDKGFHEREGIMFIGGFGHPPNEEGIIWFIDYVLPLIRKRLPDVHLTVVGSDPTDRLLTLANDAITVTGYVQDVSCYFNDSRVFVCPLLHGAGVKGKIGQSLSYGLPVVTTIIGAEGMELQDGHNALITDSEKTFADKVIQLYTDDFLWQKLSINGQEVIKHHFSADKIRAALHAVLKDTAGGQAPRAESPAD